MTTNEQPIFCIRQSHYSGTLPLFYDQKDFPELDLIKNNWQVILQEVVDYEKQQGYISGINTFSPPDLQGENPWSNIYLENFMWRFHGNRKHFPKTAALLEQVPGFTLAGFSVLSPNGTIEPHYGDTNAIIRCHLGLQIPAAHPACGIRVGNEEQGWKNGEITMFTEAHLHTTWNRSTQKRYILAFDIIHPQWRNNRYWICAKVLGAQTFVFFEKKIPLLKKIPDSGLPVIHFLLSAAWRMYLPLQRSLAVFYK